MKNNLIISSLVIAVMVALSSCSTKKNAPIVLGANPFVTHMFTADPSAHVWKDGRLYVYPSHDVDPPRGCDLMDGYHVFSTDDMVNWTDHGEILHSRQVEWGRPEGGYMWAPDCAYKDGTYYFYFPHPSSSDVHCSWRVGIATSKYPDRDFKVQGYLQGIDDNCGMIDPCVFVDDDGQAYLVHGGCGRVIGAKMKDNMVELAEAPRSMEGLHDFHEGAWLFKRNGTYYLMYADNVPHPDGNRLVYATSEKPLGPWTYQGVILDATGSGTNHGSIVEYKGEWFLFYHNSDLSGGRFELRSICVDKLYFNPDGTIKKVEQTKGLSPQE